MTGWQGITTAMALEAIARNTAALVTALGFAREAYLELEAEYAQYRADHPDDTPEPPGERVLLSVDFSGHPVGPYTRAMAQVDFGWDDPPNDDWWAERGVTIATSDGKSALTVTLAAGEWGGDSGPVFFVPIDPTHDLTFVMEVQGAPGFDGDMGGKLPGFACTIDETTPPTGGAEPNDGNSARHMWRTKGEAGDRPPNSLAVYAYHPTYTGEWGEYLFLEAELGIDNYVTLTTHAVTNSPGARDGICQSKIGEGPWTLDVDDFEWIPTDQARRLRGFDDDAWRFNRFAFAVFRGGAESGWASDKESKIQFRRFRITAPS